MLSNSEHIAFAGRLAATVTQLAYQLGVSKPTISDAVAALLDKKLLKKTVSAQDARAYHLSLTRRGRIHIDALASYADRYTSVAEQAGITFPSTVAFEVVERLPGGPTTAFAAPECRRPFPQVTAEAERAKATPAAPGAWSTCSLRPGRHSTRWLPRHRSSCARARGVPAETGTR